ncbi:2978_t:CDS:1, partial [Acaulospora morrowiae]
SGVDDIFTLFVNNGKSIEFLKNKIRANQYNLNEFDLYKKNFFQSNNALVSSLKNPTTSDNREEQLINPQKIISEYFIVLDIHALRTNPSYLSKDGKIGPINVIIYPSAE